MNAPRFKVLPIRDEAYRRSAVDSACVVCGREGHHGDVVMAHIRSGNEGGTSYKPGDDLTLPLCSQHHAEKAEEWLDVLKAIARNRYATWRRP